MQYFYIRQNSTLPTLRMELIEDGRHDFNKFHECIQGADITFTMTNIDSNVVKVAKNKAYIKLRKLSCQSTDAGAYLEDSVSGSDPGRIDYRSNHRLITKEILPELGFGQNSVLFYVCDGCFSVHITGSKLHRSRRSSDP